MSKTAIKPTPEEKKVKEGKTASREANKKSKKNKIKVAAKKLTDKAILDMATNMSAGQASEFVKRNMTLDKLDEQQEILNAAKRAEWAGLKTIKVNCEALRLVRRWRKKESADLQSLKAELALYQQSLDMYLTDEEKKVITDINVRRENSHAAMADMGGETGKEIGSGMVGHNSNAGGEGDALPERNESVGAGFRKPDTILDSTVKH